MVITTRRPGEYFLLEKVNCKLSATKFDGVSLLISNQPMDERWQITHLHMERAVEWVKCCLRMTGGRHTWMSDSFNWWMLRGAKFQPLKAVAKWFGRRCESCSSKQSKVKKSIWMGPLQEGNRVRSSLNNLQCILCLLVPTIIQFICSHQQDQCQCHRWASY